MLDEILEIFERDKKKRRHGSTGKRSLLGRVSAMVSGEDHRRHDDRYERPGYDDRRRYDDDRPRYDDRDRYDDDRRRIEADRRYEDDRHERARFGGDRDERPRYADDRFERRRDDDDDRYERRDRDDDDRYRGSEYQKPSKKKRFGDLLDFD